MPDFREIMEAERAADAVAHAALTSDGTLAPEHCEPTLRMLEAIRLEIRAQGMRWDRSITEASKP